MIYFNLSLKCTSSVKFNNIQILPLIDYHSTYILISNNSITDTIQDMQYLQTPIFSDIFANRYIFILRTSLK